MNVSIRKSKPNDIFAIQKVKKNTWIDTYPNDKQGIIKIQRFGQQQIMIKSLAFALQKEIRKIIELELYMFFRNFKEMELAANYLKKP